MKLPFTVLLVGSGLCFKDLLFKLLDVVPRLPQLFLLVSQSFLHLSKVPGEPLLIRNVHFRLSLECLEGSARLQKLLIDLADTGGKQVRSLLLIL